MFYTVYQTTNLTNGMFYIGVHKTKNPKDDYLGSGKRLKYAIEKYGFDNFRKDVLFIFETKEEAYSKEKELVTEEVLDSGKCYNLKLGGEGGWDFAHKSTNDGSAEHINRCKYASSIAWENPESRRKILDGLLKRVANLSIEEKSRIGKLGQVKLRELYPNGTWFGKVHSEESKQKMKESHLGKHEGSKNSQFGTMWITNGISNKKIKKDQEIPNGWRCGRINNA